LAVPSSRGMGATGVGMSVGGSVMLPTCGFSISIVPPHFPHFVFARGRPPSFVSSNL